MTEQASLSLYVRDKPKFKSTKQCKGRMAKRVQSPSSINLYKQCPRRYYYKYIEELPTRPSIHLIRGNVVHSALEDFFKEIPAVNGEKIGTVLQKQLLVLVLRHWHAKKDELDKLKMKPEELGRYLDESKLMVLNYAQVFYERVEVCMGEGMSFDQAFQKLTPETEKQYRCEEHMVQGFVDCIEVHEGKVRLMDYKTSNKFQITADYRLQLGIYALLYKQHHGSLPDQAGIYFLKFGQKLLDVDEQLLKDTAFEIEQVHMSTETDNIHDYPKKTGPLCKWRTGQCDFYELCF